MNCGSHSLSFSGLTIKCHAYSLISACLRALRRKCQGAPIAINASSTKRNSKRETQLKGTPNIHGMERPKNQSLTRTSESPLERIWPQEEFMSMTILLSSTSSPFPEVPTTLAVEFGPISSKRIVEFLMSYLHDPLPQAITLSTNELVMLRVVFPESRHACKSCQILELSIEAVELSVRSK